MAKVFADAGYRVSKDMERDGVLAVEFPILPTDTSVGVMERQEHRAGCLGPAAAQSAADRGLRAGRSSAG